VKRKYNLSRDGLYSLRLNAEFNRCMYCGRFISNEDRERGEIGMFDPTGPMDYEPRERIPYHKKCKEEKARSNRWPW